MNDSEIGYYSLYDSNDIENSSLDNDQLEQEYGLLSNEQKEVIPIIH